MATNITIGGVTITPEELEILAAAVVSEIETTSKEPSEYELVETVDGVTSLPAFKQTGSTFTLVRVLTSLLKGADGKQIELRANATHLQWRLLNTGAWMDLLPIEVLQQPAADAIELYGTEIQQLMATKFDAVEKRDDGLWFLADGVEVAGPIEAGGGGGSGGGIGGGSVLRLINLGSSSVGVAAGSPVVLNYTFESKDSETDDPTGDGTVAYFVNNIKIATRTVQQGANSFDVTGYLNAGSNTVRIQATDSYGAMRSLNINVMVVSLSLTSTFNDSVAYSSAIVFPYTPVGSGSKTVHFVLNGTEVGTVVTTATNRQLTYNLPALTHGAHLLEVFATMDVQGVQLASNVLQYSIIFVENNNNAVIISSVFGQTEAVQYDTLAIPFQVYNPAGQTSAVELKVNGAVVSSLTVDRTRQTWSYRIPASGTLELQIASGSASRTFNLTVENSSIDSEAETAGLELFLTSNGRSNNETNREEWISLPPTPSEGGGVAATLTGFNWKTNGWVLDGDSVTVLRVNAGASVSIPYKPFQSDFKGTGKTVEFEFSVRNVEDFGDTVIQCWSGNRGFRISANGILFSSALSSLSAKFKEEEIIRVSIVVQSIFTQRLILLYLNGIMSGAQVYSVNDDFSQASPVNITIGSPLATVDLYNIRAYNTELNAMQILNNYIADLANVAKKLAVFDRNQVYDSTGDIVYSEIVQQIPCMTIIGDLPTFKGDKKTVQIVFENRQNPEKSFTSTGVTIDVQGTSSQYYPRKNYKTNHKSGFLMTESNETLAEYQINPDNVPGSVLCSKTDYAESSGTHNTGMARFVNELLKNMNVLTPAQILDGRVRTTVDGYPITMFHRATANDPLMFVGKYNMNYDKDSQAVFGFTSPPNPSPFGEGSPECWEFLNNTSDRSLFKSADFSGSDWQNDFEARFPDGFTDKTNVEILFQWVVSCIGNPNKFKTELEQHFNKNNILTYYLLTEMFGMVDQRAKNQFLTSWGNEGTGEYKWYFIFYDNDTSFGINNEGMIAFPYSIETEDVIGSGHVWNGWDSELWKLVKSAYTDEIAVMYAQMRSSLMTYAAVSHILNEEQSAKWCEVVYNLDGQYKYIQPLIEDGNGSYLYALQGSRLEHRKWWLSNRFMYMDSRYNAADFLNDYITMRIYTPATWQGVEPDADFSLTLFKDSYVRVKYGSYVFAQRGTAGQTVLVEAPDIQFNDTETIVYGVSSVQSLGSLAAKYPGTVDISNAKKLTELIIGSPGAPPNPPERGASGYSNEKLKQV
ncbi:MAG: CotH kinase family protein [Tannerella sp.]|jgi:hypothetical protein|nr:CotH kinase family protein [Tannerella sp.]